MFTEEHPLLPTSNEQCDEDRKNSEAAIRWMLAATFVYMFPVALTIAVRPSLMLSASGNDTKKAAIFSSSVVASNALVAGITSPILGAWSDSKGRVPILKVCAAFEAVGLFGVIIFRSSLLGQFIFYQLVGFASSSVATLQAAIADVSIDPEQGHQAFARLNQVTGFAFFIGPVLGGYLSTLFSDIFPMLIAAISMSVAVPLFGYFLIETRRIGDEEDLPGHSRPRISITESLKTIRNLVFSNTALLFIFLSTVIEAVGDNGAYSILYMYTNERLKWSSEQVGLFVSVMGLQFLISQYTSARAAKLLGERCLIVIGYISLTAHYLIYTLASKSWIMWAGLPVGIPGLVANPISRAVISRQVEVSDQGKLQSSIFALTNLVMPISSMGCAVIFSAGTSFGFPGLVFVFIAGCSVMATVLANAAMIHPDLK